MPDGLNQYDSVAGATFGHDARGNLTSDGVRTMTYDVENRLLSVTGGGPGLALTYNLHRCREMPQMTYANLAGVLLLLGTNLVGCDFDQRHAGAKASGGTHVEGTAIRNPPWPQAVAIPNLDSRPVREQLSPVQVKLLEQQAYAGDPPSAWILRQYYNVPDRKFSAKTDKWEQIAAENGDYVAADFRAVYFRQLGGQQNCLRAKFWSERALQLLPKGDDENRAGLVRNLQDLADNWQACLNPPQMIPTE